VTLTTMRRLTAHRLVRGGSLQTSIPRARHATTADIPLPYLPSSTFNTEGDYHHYDHSPAGGGSKTLERTETITALSRLVRSVVEKACNEGETTKELSMPLLALSSLGQHNWGVRFGGDPGVFSSVERRLVSQLEHGPPEEYPTVLGRLTLAERMVSSAEHPTAAGHHEKALREVLEQADSTKAATVAGWCNLLQVVSSDRQEYVQLRPRVLQMLADPTADEWGDSEKMWVRVLGLAAAAQARDTSTYTVLRDMLYSAHSRELLDLHRQQSSGMGPSMLCALVDSIPAEESRSWAVSQVTVAVSQMNDEVALHDLYTNQAVCFRVIEQSENDMERVLSLVGAWYASYLTSLKYNPDIEWRLSTGAMRAAIQLLSSKQVPKSTTSTTKPATCKFTEFTH